MIYKCIPKEFNPRFEIVSCYMECGGEILLLHRQDSKSEGNRWGVPAGKIDKGENEPEAMIREIKEETGQKVLPGKLEYLKKVYVKYPEYHFIYHMFRLRMDRKPSIKLDRKEHKDHQWIRPLKALELHLVRDLDKCIRLFY